MTDLSILDKTRLAICELTMQPLVVEIAPSRDALIRRWQIETGCGYEVAHYIVDILEQISAHAIRDQEFSYVLSPAEMDLIHSAFEAAIADEAVAVSGTLHADCEAYMSTPTVIVTLRHSLEDRYTEGDECVFVGIAQATVLDTDWR